MHIGSGPYYIPNVEIRSRAVFTNLPVTGAMRGYGVPQVAFAHELQMDALAEKLGLDPIEIRLRNMLRPGQTMATGQEVPEGTAAEACLPRMRGLLEREKEAETEAVAATGDGGGGGSGEAGGGDSTHRLTRARKRSAWGVAFSFYGNGARAGDTGRCRLRRESDGTYTLYVGIPDVGQGSTTALAQIACLELGIPWEALKVLTADTATTPPTGPAAATRVTVIVGRAVPEACRQMKERMSEGSDGSVEVAAEFRADSTPRDDDGHGRPYITYTSAAHAAKVEVDTGTGRWPWTRCLPSTTRARSSIRPSSKGRAKAAS